MGMPAKSHFAATRHVSSVRHFLLPLIDYSQSLRSATHSDSIHNTTGTIFVELLKSGQQVNLPQSEARTFVMVLKQQCCACCRKREATPLLEQRLWLPASREVAGRRRATGTEHLVYPGAGKSLTRKYLLPYTGPDHCFGKYVVWGLHSNGDLGQGCPTRDTKPYL